MVVKLSFETIYDPVLEKKVKGFEIVRLKKEFDCRSWREEREVL